MEQASVYNCSQGLKKKLFQIVRISAVGELASVFIVKGTDKSTACFYTCEQGICLDAGVKTHFTQYTTPIYIRTLYHHVVNSDS